MGSSEVWSIFELDDDGYPTEETLSIIQHWEVNNFKDCVCLLRLVIHVWKWWDKDIWRDESIILTTGGWSGNESLICSMERNMMFWNLCWYSSTRGGRYEFRPQYHSKSIGLGFGDE